MWYSANFPGWSSLRGVWPNPPERPRPDRPREAVDALCSLAGAIDVPATRPDLETDL